MELQISYSVKLRKQTIEAFKKLCERIFKEDEENFR